MGDVDSTSAPDQTDKAVPTGVGERRPIASRNTGWAQRITEILSAWGISPNAISVASIGCGLVAGVCFALSAQVDMIWARALLILAAACIQLRLLCNLFDGMVAVHTGKFSPSGELYNEVPDRISDAFIFIGAGYAVGSAPELGYVAAVVAVFVAYARAMGKIVSGKQDFRGPMAKPHRMALMTISALYVALTPIAWQPRLGEKGQWRTLALALLIIVVGGLWTAWRRLSSAAESCQAAAENSRNSPSTSDAGPTESKDAISES